MTTELLVHEAVKMGLILSDENLMSFNIFATELIKWNNKVNLTSITNEKEIAIKHFIDCLHLAPHVLNQDIMLDIGSGGGLPVIPLKIVRPETTMVSVDAVGKKINFQRHVIRLLGLKNIEALHSRIEDLAKSHAGKFSLITSRAFTRLDHFVSLASPLLAADGRIIAMKGLGADDEITESSDVLRSLGFSITSQQTYSLPNNMGTRVLLTIMFCKPA
ncbi:MAG: 16S rRNA (guanine(527)-N(7))-methyltransferase RsmG [Geobacteraceae bacterium GWC2_55_20]|nr:MAG: 16S rRNA (guanine(527)-N(7))-methyltransferase RsmG [Geobacteraceae bacterium GWC2_55_20]HCE66374.1 16S rRNA (guanine(527)-N(7))-methyltransferase RsmG [Geobacter sp.]